MARADYISCEVCDGKGLYDGYRDIRDMEDIKVAVLCPQCAQTHILKALPKPELVSPAPETKTVGWEHISSAPRDGSDVLVWNGWRRHVAAWDHIESAWVSSFRTTTKRLEVLPAPTHWQPLPAEPPALASEGQAAPRNPQQSYHTEKYDGID